MTPMLEEEYRNGLRKLLATKSVVVKINEQDRQADPNNPEFWVSPYGWKDHDATNHVRTPTANELKWYGADAHRDIQSCGLYIPRGAQIQEVAYSEFQGTFVDNESHIGINAYGGGKSSETQIRCNCSKYRGLTVRWQGSLQEALTEILGLNRATFTL